ncbi:hypothetical protein SCUCBS95973_004040 [Sporothrix curviconia]|uniref:Uncharacterized protein n=1 Tax=Sporothrix curviconia TaxID=1260050 RepID=A0ABP0BLL0_9PEZI
MSPGGSITNGQQQAGTSSSQQSRLLRPLAPAPVRQLPQPQVQTRPLHAAGGSHYGHSEQGAHALQGLDHQGQNWQHSPHLNSMGYSEQDAANYYRVPWQVDHTAHQSNVSRHYDPAATIAQHTMGTDYNTSHDGYAAAPHHDYHPH